MVFLALKMFNLFKNGCCFGSAKFGQMSAFLKLQIICNNLKLGEMHECQDALCEKATEYYRKFLDSWKDADPGIPEVDDAKKRLAGLKSQY